jgi:hypothetical protein
LADRAIETAVLDAVEPGAIAAAIEAGTRQATQRDEVAEALRRDLEAARYAADRAFRQYDAADPENRLVAAELEARWNRALARVAEVEARIAAHDRATPPDTDLSASCFATLAGDLRAVWSAPATDASLKKRIVRTLIQEVVADIDDAAGEVVLTIHWMGGAHTELRVERRRPGQSTRTAPDIVAAVRQLVCIADDEAIAGILNRNKLATGLGNRWTRERVASLRSSHNIPVHRRAADGNDPWLNLSDAAACLQVNAKTLRLAVTSGRIEALRPLPDGPWLFSRAVLEGPAAKALVDRARKRAGHPAGPDPDQRSLFSSTT